MQNYIRKEFAHKSFAVSIEGDNIKPLSKPDRDLLWGLKKVDKNRWITGFFDVKEDENAQGWGLDKRIFHPRDIRAGYFSFSEIADNQVSFELSTNSRLKGVIKFENIRCLFFAFNTISDYLRRCGDAEKLDFNTISENLTKTYLAKCQYKEYLLKKINELKINIEYSSRSVPRKDNRFYEKVMIENDDLIRKYAAFKVLLKFLENIFHGFLLAGGHVVAKLSGKLIAIRRKFFQALCREAAGKAHEKGKQNV